MSNAHARRALGLWRYYNMPDAYDAYQRMLLRGVPLIQIKLVETSKRMVIQAGCYFAIQPEAELI